jgi:hypothetical protein
MRKSISNLRQSGAPVGVSAGSIAVGDLCGRRARRILAIVITLILSVAGTSMAGGLVVPSTAATARVRSASTGPITGFLAEPTDQIAVPGMISGAEITPEGDLYTGWAEYELRFGDRLARWDQPTRVLPNPGVPLLSSTLWDGPVRYTETVFAVALAGRAVAYQTVTARNDASDARRARVAMAIAYTRGRQLRGPHLVMTGAYRYERPVSAQADGFYDQPGQSFSPTFEYSIAGRDLDRSGLLLARGPAAPSRLLAGSPGSPLTATHDARLFSVRLRPGGQVSFTWQIPLDPQAPSVSANESLDSLPLNAARIELESMWHAQEAGMMQISVPEQKVVATYRAAIVEMLASRFQTEAGWVQASNKLQYQAFWIRDGALETQALDLAGLHQQAAQNLAFLDTYQQPDGLFISRTDQYDGLGEALWALDQHARLTRDAAYAAAQLPRIGAAIAWLSAATATDPLGLLPAGNPGDNELAYGHITGDDLWAAAGLRSAIADAKLAGREDLAAAWQAVDDRFEASLDSAIAAAYARTGHIPPVLDASGGQDWGNYYAAYPVQVLPASSPEVEATMAWARAHMLEGLPTYDNGESLHDYLGFGVFQTELAEGEVSNAVAGLYAELVHTTSTDEGWEWGVAPFGDRASPVNLAPHGTFAGDYVALLRNMLVAEGAAGGVQLLAGASPAWLAPGRHITVTAAPTASGVISFTERSRRDGETLTWKSTLARGTALTWTLPAWARGARTANGAVSGSSIELRGSVGSLTVTFGGRRPRQSYALAVASLNRAYRAHGRPAPLVAVTR